MSPTRELHPGGQGRLDEGAGEAIVRDPESLLLLSPRLERLRQRLLRAPRGNATSDASVAGLLEGLRAASEVGGVAIGGPGEGGSVIEALLDREAPIAQSAPHRMEGDDRHGSRQPSSTLGDER